MLTCSVTSLRLAPLFLLRVSFPALCHLSLARLLCCALLWGCHLSLTRFPCHGMTFRSRSGPTTGLNDSRLSLSTTSTPTTAAAVSVTPLSRLPGHRVLHHLGPLTMHLIKETNAVREAGGVHNFVQLFISEVCIWCTEPVSTPSTFASQMLLRSLLHCHSLRMRYALGLRHTNHPFPLLLPPFQVLAMARSQVHSRGGNALVGFRIKDLDIIDNVHKNQAQCLLAIQGTTGGLRTKA